MEDTKSRAQILEEVNKLKDWFDAQVLPSTIQVDRATYIPDLKKTVNMLIEQVNCCHADSTMQGCFIILNKIKKKLEEDSQVISLDNSVLDNANRKVLLTL